MRQLFAIGILVWMLACSAYGQEVRFSAEVQDFKHLDGVQPPFGQYMLMLGSSSFTLWKRAGEDFPNVPVVNRAFGGSTLQDLWIHREALVNAYRPAQVLMYCGENDFAESDTIEVATVVRRFVDFFTYLRQVHPSVPFAYVSMKPSPSRRHLLPKFEAANSAIRTFLKTKPKTAFIDVYQLMLDPDGQLKGNLFLADSLHMNAAGYRLWQHAIQKTFAFSP